MQQADNPSEMLDLVNIHDEVVGVMSRGEVYMRGLKNFRVVHAFIQNDAGALWIPRRVATKKLYPSALDFSVAGHVESGESYEEALIKEAREEVRLLLTPNDYIEIGHLVPHRDGVGVFQKVYLINSNEVPHYDEAEFQSYEWLQPQEILERSKKREKMKSDIPKAISICGLA